MEADRDQEWALFENRPARERTAVQVDQYAEASPQWTQQSAPRTRPNASNPEHIKC